MFLKISKIFSIYRQRLNYTDKISKASGRLDQQLRDCFGNNTAYSQRYNALIDYFINSYSENVKENKTRGYFKGEFSYHPVDFDAIEGASRFMPFIAAIVAFESEHPKHNELLQELKLAFVTGTDPKSLHYWGELEDYSQLICEAADIALALWIARDSIWPLCSSEEKTRILDWLKQAESKQIVDNNWHLFILTINVVVNYFEGAHQVLVTHFERVKEFYLGDGWFQDGVGGSVDYYNAWAFQYSLYWISEINPELDRGYFSSINALFCKKYQYFFTPNGYPFFGRSICYRTAAPCPLIILSLLRSDLSIFQEVRNVFDHTWKYFILNNGIKNGLPTQGYFESNPLMVDEYSGPASSLWGIRSLILMVSAEHKYNYPPFESRPLPVEKAAFEQEVADINLLIVGDNDKQVVNVIWQKREKRHLDWDKFTFIKRVKQAISQRPQRPKNYLIKNKLAKYTSDFKRSFLNVN